MTNSNRSTPSSANPAKNAAEQGAYERDTTYIEDRFSSSLEPGSQPTANDDSTYTWPVEPGRYRLMAARACPWAHRSIITRRLLGLEDAISLGLAGPTHDADSWVFDVDPGEVDPVTGLHRLKDAYENRYPDYPRGITVPAIVEVDDTDSKVVTNDFRTIPVSFIDDWAQLHRDSAPDLYPADLRGEIDEVADYVYKNVNNGVYRCGFTRDQGEYEKAYRELWEALDWLEERLGKQRYLVGEHITLADIYLYPTLVRFDPVYVGHFKASRNRIEQMPNLRGYLQELYQLPGFGDTTDFTEIKQHYYITHTEVNPSGVVPVGPDMSWIVEPHDRDRFGGAPFAEGVSDPRPVRDGEEVKNPADFDGRR
ncbi:glutathione S-transferase C-terminal domain-containing protein [Corynebacterium sp.]|uniref:glutathione S-transferase C-terminal domain-containing protein n=1 Tax=Corynebacterium sp. TaxID=1720 RepID=UPI002A913451|nr:glutathione S-transferase C-terminal domain-containing protein [Corynebacterium sp.]MDY5784769.1 glutathione S-transferase C-terminal domain-containing protein [Corynebacterium sp.]